MTGKILRFSLFLAVIAGTAFGSPAAGIKGLGRAEAQAGELSEAQYLELLAETEGVSAASLELADVGTLELIDGSTVTRVKALDRTKRAAVGASFRDGKAVDEEALKATVTAAWREAHGRLTYPLVEKLTNSLPDEKFTVSVWLIAEIEPLPKPSDEAAQQPAIGATSTANPVDLGAAAKPSNGGKVIEKPLRLEQVPPEILKALAGALPEAPVSDSAEKTRTEVDKNAARVDEESEAEQQKLERAAEFDRLNQAHVKAQVSGPRQRFLDYTGSKGYEVQYASELAPLVFLTGLTRREVEELGYAEGVDAVYDASMPSGPALEIARSTQNGNLVEDPDWHTTGYDGSGVNVAVVEGERMWNANPYLAVTGTRDTSRAFKDHPTAVGGMIASTHGTVRGLAPGATMYSANGDDYATTAALEAAMDWGATNATVMNHSFYADCGASTSLTTIDRHMDYLVRSYFKTAVVASGNFNDTTCGGNPVINVNAPGKGFNALTVGAFDDKNTPGWSDDTMAMNGAAVVWSQYNHDGRYKPEIAASGVAINSTTRTAPYTGDTGSGTSYASPMVAATAANIIDANPDLYNDPEIIASILMASALNNIEGEALLSRQDGAGGLDASAALVSVERGNFRTDAINSGTTFPMTIPVGAWAGDHVRFAMRWLSNASGDYTSDPQPVDLDLSVYRPDGTTFVTASNSSTNNYEIVDFVAPVTGTYNMRIEFWSGTWSGGTYLGSAWWSDGWHVPPNILYGDPASKPMGNHIAYDPNVWTGYNYWRAMGIRSVAGTDHDLQMFSHSFFDDPGLRVEREYSGSTTGTDFIMVDGNHWGAAQEQYRTNVYNGSGSVYTYYSTQQIALDYNGIYGPYTLGGGVVHAFDVYFNAGANRIIAIVPTGANTADLRVNLFKSDPGSQATWSRDKFDYITFGNLSSAPGTVEKVQGRNTGAGDWYGLAVSNENGGNAEYYIFVEDMIFLPVIRR